VSDRRDFPAPPASAHAEEAGGLRYPGFGTLLLILTVVGILTSLRHQLQRPAGSEFGDLPFLIAFTACYYPWLVFAPVVFRLERRFPLGDGRWGRNLGALALISLPLCLAVSPLTMATFRGILNALQEPAFHPAPMRFLFSHFPMSEVLFWCSVAGGYFVRTQFHLREQERRTAQLALEKSQLEAGLKQAQLDVIRARLNPHFLFNSLQNISAMTKQDPLTASRMLARLGDLLRAVLRQDSEPECSVFEEIALTRDYAALEQMRFGSRLAVEFRIAPEAQGAMVPCFLLQPLIENAIIHGLRVVGKTGVITVTAIPNGGDLVLTVSDNGVGPPDDALSGKKMGVGLGSTRERLATMFPERHSFQMTRSAEGGAEVRIAFPLRLAVHNEDTATSDRR